MARGPTCSLFNPSTGSRPHLWPVDTLCWLVMNVHAVQRQPARPPAATAPQRRRRARPGGRRGHTVGPAVDHHYSQVTAAVGCVALERGRAGRGWPFTFVG
jgi:hypothetical protein